MEDEIRGLMDAEEQAARLQRGEITAEVQALWELMEADTWASSRRVVEAHPELLTDSVDDLLDKLVAAAWQKEDVEVGSVLAEHHEFLKRCRAVGSETAMHEFDGTLPD